MKIALRRRRASAKLSEVDVRSYGSTRDVAALLQLDELHIKRQRLNSVEGRFVPS
jgi:hypothetical protein